MNKRISNVSLFVVALLVSFFILNHCGPRKQENPPPQNAQQGAPQAPGGPLLAGAGVPPFPHPEDWVNPQGHGGWVALAGKDACMQCHPLDPVAGGGGAPACHSCHTLFPHAEDWIQKEKHGGFVKANSKASCMTACHGVDLQGGFSQLACNACHALFPHSRNWSTPAEHGETAKGDGKRLCIGCHGDDFLGGSSGVSCYQCHETFPHERDWLLPEKHGAFVVEQGDQGCRAQCHGLDLNGGLSGKSCNSCHELYPHPPAQEWLRFEGHGQFILGELNNDKTPCKNCHGNDLMGGRSAKSCYRCHENFPHDTFDANWLANHGPRAYGPLKNSCGTANCHGLDLRGGAQAPSCFVCHAEFPHTSPNWMQLLETRAAQGRGEEFHGDRFIRKAGRGEIESCTVCHGVNYDREMNGVSCLSCHERGISHLPRVAEDGVAIPWPTGLGHGSFFTSGGFSSYSADTPCKKCHGSPADFSRDQTLEVLRNQSDCYRCHFAYPHKSWEGVSPWGVGGGAHFRYLSDSPLFVDAQGRRRPENIQDLGNIPMIQHSCAGSTELSCHFQGLRASNTILGGSGLCAGYCHTPAPERINAPPQVASRNPEDQATGVAVNGSVEVQFSESMDPQTVVGAFTLSRVADGALVPGEVTCSQDWCRQANFRPRNWLTRNTVYRATVSPQARDLDGVALVANGNSWTFITDATVPRVISSTPADRSVNIPVATRELIVRFNEQIRCNSVNRNNSISLSIIRNGVLTPVAGNTRCLNAGNVYDTAIKFTIIGRVPLAYETTYVANVLGGIQDLAGNAVPAGAQIFQWSFTTEFAEEFE